MKYSIIMPYLTRSQQLWNTLITLEHWYELRGDVEVIIVPDAKNSPEEMVKLRNIVKQFDLKIRLVEPKEGKWNSPGPHYNIGVEAAAGEFVILTSPEVMHPMNILSGLDKHDKSTYVVCACESGTDTPEANEMREIKWTHKDWYQHTVHRPSNYHFCTRIRKDIFLAIGGFDEEFGIGIAFDDNEWRDTVIVNGIEIVPDDTLIAVHQDHIHFILGIERRAIWQINRDLYAKKCIQRGIAWNEN